MMIIVARLLADRHHRSKLPTRSSLTLAFTSTSILSLLFLFAICLSWTTTTMPCLRTTSLLTVVRALPIDNAGRRSTATNAITMYRITTHSSQHAGQGARICLVPSPTPSTCRHNFAGPSNRFSSTSASRFFRRGLPMFSTTATSFSSREQAEEEEKPASNFNVPPSKRDLYEELKALSLEILKHDELYYNNYIVGAGIDTIDMKPIDDDEFDALVRREELLATEHPDLLKAWQIDSGRGVQAIRSGRVGIIVGDDVGPVVDDDDDIIPSSSTPTLKLSSSAQRLKRRHLSPMLSLDNVHNDEQLWNWLKRVLKTAAADMIEGDDNNENNDKEAITMEIITEPKLDGVSLSLRYETKHSENAEGNNILDLKWASTRGDGKVGQDVTTAILQMADESDIPRQIVLPSSHNGFAELSTLEVRGEVVLPRTEFLKLQKQTDDESKSEMPRLHETIHDEHNGMNADVTSSSRSSVSSTASSRLAAFANARNAASGLLMRKESDNEDEEEESRKLRYLLQFYAYDIAYGPSNNTNIDDFNGISIRKQLEDWGFNVAMPSVSTTLNLKGVALEVPMEESLTEQIQPLMTYYKELQEYRESLDSSSDSQNEGSVHNLSSTNSKWGDFDMDGCVHKISDARIRTSMGTSMKSPRWAVAHKFPAQSAVTKLLDIIVQVGRTGALTPVAVLEPTEVGGVTIQRATLHNFDHMREVLLGDSWDADRARSTNDSRVMRGEMVLIKRAGDVIPQVIRRVGNRIRPDDSVNVDAKVEDKTHDKSRWITLDPPDTCPACGSHVLIEDIKSSAKTLAPAQLIRCGGPPLLCPPRAIASLSHAFSRDALDVSGLSEARIKQLMDAGLLRYPKDIFEFDEDDWSTAANLPRWGQKSCKNLKDSIERVATAGVPLGRFIYSLGIRHVGKQASELVASSYGSTEAFFGALIDARSAMGRGSNMNNETQDQLFPLLQSQLGIGPVMIQSLLEFSQSDDLLSAAQSLSHLVHVFDQDNADAVPNKTAEQESNQKPWRGLTVVFTGKLGSLSRSEAQSIAKRLGAKSSPSSLSKSTDILVCGDKSGPKKTGKAKEFGVKVMTMVEFMNLADAYSLK